MVCHLRRKVIRAIVHTLFRTIPCLPELSDWTKLGPCLDFFLGAQHMGILRTLLQRAQWAMALPQRAAEGDDEVAEAGRGQRAAGGAIQTWEIRSPNRFSRSRSKKSELHIGRR